MNNGLNLIFDCDNTIADTDEAVLEFYRSKTGDNSTTIKDNHKSWYFDDLCPLWDRKTQLETFVDEMFFYFLKPKEGAVEALKQFKEDGHTIIICTVHDSRASKLKLDWIKKYFPFVDAVYLISNNENKMDKSFIYGDVIFDDNVDNLESANCRHKVCFGDYSWNKDWEETIISDEYHSYIYENIKYRTNDFNQVKELVNNLSKLYSYTRE